MKNRILMTPQYKQRFGHISKTLNPILNIFYKIRKNYHSFLSTHHATHKGIEFLVGMGKSLNEPNVFGGPFVMTTADQLLETKRRFGRGEMGQLAPSR
jgi:hypothetical protein